MVIEDNPVLSRKRLLYVSTNDGSDTRINKEVKALSRYFDIDFIGIGLPGKAFAKEYCKEFVLVSKPRKNIMAWIELTLRACFFALKNRYHSIHLINEQLLVLLYPLGFFNHIVVDLFDSFFLKTSHKGWYMELIRWWVFLPASKIIVTDDNRNSLMPSYLKRKTCVVENYPNFISFEKSSNSSKVVIFYTGWMGIRRGTELMQRMVDEFEDVELWMAGWFADEVTVQLSKHPKVKYWGVLPQAENMKLAAQADYILCLYAPIHENNINASPNKIYDAIQVKTPVIINQEIVVSKFVKDYELGVIVPQFDDLDIHLLHAELVLKKGSFHFDDSIKKKFCWENIERKLIDCHL